MPAIGRNAVNSSTNIAAAITQWNNRATSEWRPMREADQVRSFEGSVPATCLFRRRSTM